jgi:two-component system alkaline phosphatase synthesis response regulator PhoP
MQDGKNVILAIDDDQDFLDTLRILIETDGYIMEEASTAESGLKMFKKIKPDAVLVDLMMEEIDAGANFVKELKLIGADVPVFLLSSAGDGMLDAVDYTSIGFSGVFQKPPEPKHLLSMLKAKLG